MTEKELKKLHYIKIEIEVLINQLKELKDSSPVKGQNMTGMPFGGGISDKTSDRAMAELEIEEMYNVKIKELFLTRVKIERYINTVDNEEMRLIIRLRCIEDRSWGDVAAGTMILDDEGNVIKERTRTSIYRKFTKFLIDSENAHIAHYE